MGKMVYDRVRNVLYEESNEITKDRALRARKAAYAAEMRAQEKENDIRRRGYCSRCGLLLPISGICECGNTTRRVEKPKKEIVNHKTGQVKGGWVHPGILAMYDK